MIKLYENIKAYRKKNGWTQQELAKRAGYTDRSSIAKIESGAVDLSQSKINQFAEIFDVTPSELMGWDENTNDFIADVVIRMQSDSDFLGAVMALYELDIGRVASVRKMLEAFK